MEYLNNDWIPDESEFYSSEIKNRSLEFINQSLATCSIAVFNATDIFKRSSKDGIVINVGETKDLETELGKLFGAVISACNRGILNKNNIFSNADMEHEELEEILSSLEQDIKDGEEFEDEGDK